MVLDFVWSRFFSKAGRQNQEQKACMVEATIHNPSHCGHLTVIRWWEGTWEEEYFVGVLIDHMVQ